MKVVVGVDGSSNSFAAVAFIGRLIVPDRDELMLFFATPAMSFDDERLDPAVQDRARSALSRAILDAALERLPEQWRGRAQQKDVVGAPGQQLVETATDFDANLIVVGFHGTSSIIEQFMLGSVSRTVLQSGKCSVLVVKGGDTVATPEATTTPLRALAAYELEHSAETMANMLKQLSWPPNAEGYVITVVRPMFLAELPDWVISRPRDPDVAAMADAWRKEHEQNLLAARQELEQFRAMLPACFPRNEAIVAEGRPAEQIIKTARDNKVDLVVLGSGDAGRLERLLVGSTSEQVLASGTSSVLIVR